MTAVDVLEAAAEDDGALYASVFGSAAVPGMALIEGDTTAGPGPSGVAFAGAISDTALGAGWITDA